MVETTLESATIDPKKTALVIVDFQNYFLSPLLGRPNPSPNLDAVKKLVDIAIPACWKAQIPVVWLGWGLEDGDLEDMPPAIVRGFRLGRNFDETNKIGELGKVIRQVTLEDGTVIDAGRALMRDQWNTQFYHLLAKTAQKDDIQHYKNRLSGYWGGTGIEARLKDRGIKTLLFASRNVDQCVASK
jgi:nicotinamidase-related amidase